MKTKLLRKVRKRFTVESYIHIYEGSRYEMYRVYDKRNWWSCDGRTFINTVAVHNYILNKVFSDYSHIKTKRYESRGNVTKRQG